METHSSKPWNARIVEGIKSIKQHSDRTVAAHKAKCRATYDIQLEPIFKAEQALQLNWNDQSARDKLNEAQLNLNISDNKN